MLNDKVCILIVDDEADIIEILRFVLESNGYEKADQYFILKDFVSYAEAVKLFANTPLAVVSLTR